MSFTTDFIALARRKVKYEQPGQLSLGVCILAPIGHIDI